MVRNRPSVPDSGGGILAMQFNGRAKDYLVADGEVYVARELTLVGRWDALALSPDLEWLWLGESQRKPALRDLVAAYPTPSDLRSCFFAS